MSSLLFFRRPRDTTAPAITAGPSAGSLTTSGATITWTTDERSDSIVEYGPTSAYGIATDRDSAKVTSHSVALTDLSENTTYHYRVVSQDNAGNIVTSDDGTFSTVDGTGPVITAVAGSESKRATNVSGAQVTVTWTTNEASSSKVEYGTVASAAFGSATSETDTAPRVTSHSVTVTGLVAETAYQFRPVSRDATLNSTTGATVTVTTEWTPSLLVAKTVLWLEAGLETGADLSTTQTPVDHSAVSTGILTQSVAGQRPTLHNASDAAFANGKPCWSFNGTSQSFIRGTDYDTWDLTGDTACLVVFKRPTGAAASDVLIGHSDVTTNTRRWEYGIDATGHAYVFNDGKGSNQASSATFDDDVNHAVFWNRAGTSTEVYTAGTLDSTFTSMSNTAPTGTTRLGAVTSGANLYTGDISLVILFNDDLTSGERVKLFNYVMPRYVTAPDVTAPVLSSVAATETAVSTFVAGASVTVTWTTDEASSSRVEYSTDSGFAGSTTTSETDTAPRVTSHSVTVTGLTENTTYYFRPKSKDASANDGTGATVTVTTTWTPKALGSIVQLWVDASLQTATEGATVTDLTDYSNNAVTLHQGTAGSRPVYTHMLMNGAPAFQFVSSDWMEVADAAGMDLTGDCSVVVAFRTTSSTAAPILCHASSGPTADTWSYGLSDTGAMRMVTSGGGTDDGTFTGLNDGQNHVAAWVRTGSTVVLSIDGATHDTFTSVSNAAPNDVIRIATNALGVAFYTGDVAFVLVCNDDLTAGQLDSVWGYVS